VLNKNKLLDPLKKILLYLGYFIPALFISGPFFSGLAVILFSLICLFLITYEKKFYFIKNFIFIIIILWSLYLIFISLISINPLSSLGSSLFYFRFSIMALGYWYLLENEEFFLYNFTKIICIIFLILSFDAFIQFLFNYNIFGWKYEMGRASSFFGEEKILGSYLSRLFPFALIFFLIIDKKNSIIKFASFLLIAVSAVIISGDRVAFLYTIFSLLILFLIYKSKLINKLFFISVIFLVIFLIDALGNNKIYNRLILTTIDDFRLESPDAEDKDITLLNKNIIPSFFYECYKFSYNEFKKNKILGVGPKISRDLFDLETSKYKNKKEYERYTPCISHPHNTYIQLFLETGFIGTTPVIVIFLIVLFLISKLLIINFKSYNLLNSKKILLYNCVFISLFPFVPTGNFFGSHINILIYIPLGFILYLNSKKC
jgi:O-antigen ligase